MEGCSFKGASQVSKRSSKGVSRQFQTYSRVLKKVSSVFQENFIKSFKNLSMKFCIAILLQHESHRSYPSRRRACFSLTSHFSFVIFYTKQDTLIMTILIGKKLSTFTYLKINNFPSFCLKYFHFQYLFFLATSLHNFLSKNYLLPIYLYNSHHRYFPL